MQYKLTNELSDEKEGNANRAVINENWRRNTMSNRLGSQHAMWRLLFIETSIWR